jgi:hypothetical protein
LLSGCEKRVQGDFVECHSDKFSAERLLYVLQAGLQDFVGQTIVAQDVGQECLEESLVDPFIRKQVLDVELVPRMLAVKSGNQFPRIKISKQNDLDFSKAEPFLFAGQSSTRQDGLYPEERE